MEETQKAQLSGFSLCDIGYVGTRAVLHKGTSVAFRSPEHLAQFCGALQPSKRLQSTRGRQGAMLKASASFFPVSLPLTFYSEAEGEAAGQ